MPLLSKNKEDRSPRQRARCHTPRSSRAARARSQILRPGTRGRGKDRGPRPGSPRVRGLTSGLRGGPAALPLLLGRVLRRKGPSSQFGGSRLSPKLSRGGRAQPAEGRADAAGRDAGSAEAASGAAGGERFAAASSDTASPDARRTTPEWTGPRSLPSNKRTARAPAAAPPTAGHPPAC
ncbi:hypothetical protein NN561_014207 [Cricetulus griseus]